MTQWTITKDLLANPKADPGTNENAVGLVGPDYAAMKHDELVKHPEAKRFRMYDDDGVLYYEGALVGPDEFAPLDDFGGPNAGCTRIDYLENGVWRPPVTEDLHGWIPCRVGNRRRRRFPEGRRGGAGLDAGPDVFRNSVLGHRGEL